MAEEYKNFIGGEWVKSKSNKTFENRNPADTSDLVGTFQLSSQDDVDAAVRAAQAAYPAWRDTPAPERADYMYSVANKLRERKEEISRLMTREMGKVIAETRGDMQEGIDTADFAAGEGRRMHGQTVPSELRNKAAYVIHRPMGVWGLITPWNFPIAIPTWKTFPAITTGNTIVIKPATDTPACTAKLMEILDSADIPKGVINYVTGSGRVVGEHLINHPDVKGISFTGSSEVGKRIGEVTGKTLKRCSLELGGKNGQIVMDDANLELALDGVLWGAFGTTGQRCTATSRIIVQEGVHEEFLAELVKRAKALKVGNGLDESVEMGPLVSKTQQETVASYVKIGLEEDKAELVCGGHALTEGDYAKGFFFEPTIFDKVKPEMRIAQEEIFGPVLSVITVKDLDEAIEVLNGTVYGLSSSIYTQDVNNAMRAIERIEAGITYVNGPTIGAECHLPFGGVKETGNGHREGGWTAYEIFTEMKTVYIDYSGKLQRAQIDNK
ncbi:aldehyde dehydrogenase [candidate division TA06 bacterium B3_TA06]|uniref:Aldehyde dehydrogenase n=1 Tax=candidate division TA06 bacterium B3_TA06 TaxID=2012487 RepID=A0A532UP63_UNCT6|nr:MAG: aldehyde dehydrogenase [candidate division TA06 bacterium B3_TA06]